eukprot:TRINITY_DN5965_c0_g3_i4.p1 TRINITY_DN5965_c0_g3~~TRINITY_DN5965_c0_g3_i4.p1  ORF type:complete len:110 (-),score=34.49 TRINITY_DN5965_c0_g3_i4:26-355(-)
MCIRDRSTWGIDRALEIGVSYEGYNDLFIINSFVMFTSLFSKWFWIAYLTVPGYGLFHLLKFCWGYIGTTNYAEDTKGDDDGSKKKKEKAEKVKYKTCLLYTSPSPRDS